MSCSCKLFSELTAAYPTFDALKAFLLSRGIQMNAKEGEPLVMCRYNRETADLNDPLVRMFRSVIWNSNTNSPVFVAPMKSEPFSTLPQVFPGTMISEDFVDGVMVNLFYDFNTNKWRIATRSRLDADNKFYERTFADLFVTTWNSQFGTDFNSHPLLIKGYGYSFVLQHPANRIVVPTVVPKLVCVEVSCFTQDGTLHTQPASLPGLMPPQRFQLTNTSDLAQLIAGFETYEGLNRQGVVLKDVATGRRWKVRTNMYMGVRKLRGNHSRMEYVWFENLRNGTLETYLALYPEERANCAALSAAWSQVVTDSYNWYVRAFKVRDTPKDQIPAHLKGLLYDLHGHYVKVLAPAKQSLTWLEWQKMLSQQDLKRQVFLSTFKVGVTPPPKKALSQKQKPQNATPTSATVVETM